MTGIAEVRCRGVATVLPALWIDFEPAASPRTIGEGFQTGFRAAPSSFDLHDGVPVDIPTAHVTKLFHEERDVREACLGQLVAS